MLALVMGAPYGCWALRPKGTKGKISISPPSNDSFYAFYISNASSLVPVFHGDSARLYIRLSVCLLLCIKFVSCTHFVFLIHAPVWQWSMTRWLKAPLHLHQPVFFQPNGRGTHPCPSHRQRCDESRDGLGGRWHQSLDAGAWSSHIASLHSSRRSTRQAVHALAPASGCPKSWRWRSPPCVRESAHRRNAHDTTVVHIYTICASLLPHDNLKLYVQVV